MRLPPDQVERFYAIWKPLILYVNCKLQVEPAMLNIGLEEAWDPRMVFPIRKALWANDPVREAFIAENPAKLSPADLAIVKSWRYRVSGSFYIFRHLKKHSLLLKGPEVYAVLGLASSLDEIVPFTPGYAEAVLIPFEEHIIYDSMMVPYNIFLGPGIRRNLENDYKDAKERGAIHTSLLPHPASHGDEQGVAGEVNARVLAAFRKHLYRLGLSPKVVERDVKAVAAFADEFLATQPQPHSLRDFCTTEVRHYLAHLRSANLKESERKQHLTALTRCLRFLRDTGRMDFALASTALDVLKKQKQP